MTRLRHPALLLPLLAVVYLPFAGGGFATDDFVHLQHLRRDVGSLGALVGSPDGFGFFRPFTQLSLQIDRALFGTIAGSYRVESILLHAFVIAVAYTLASRLLQRTDAAVIATLAWALTPKAAPIAALWVSARGELLMTLFAMLSVLAWVRWSRGGGVRWLGAAVACYALSLSSKETAILLPLLLPFIPGATRGLRSRAAALAAMLGVTVTLLVARVYAGALLPTTADAHYSMATPLLRWARTALNYSGRMLPVPAVIAATMAIAALIARVSGKRGASLSGPSALLAFFSLAWTVVFLLPVLPVTARNELYLYAPVFGLCLLCGAAAASLLDSVPRQLPVAALALVTVAFTVYQGMRARELHEAALFSERLVDALDAHAEIGRASGFIALQPGDATTRAMLQDAVGGYLDIVLREVTAGASGGAVDYGNGSLPQPALRVIVRYRDGAVLLSPAVR